MTDEAVTAANQREGGAKVPLKSVHSPLMRRVARLTRACARRLVPNSTRRPDAGVGNHLSVVLEREACILESEVKKRRVFGASTRLDVRLILDAHCWDLDEATLLELSDLFTHSEHSEQMPAPAAQSPSASADVTYPQGHEPYLEGQDVAVDPVVARAGALLPDSFRAFTQACADAITANYSHWGQLSLLLVLSLDGRRYRLDARAAGFPGVLVTPQQLAACLRRDV